MSQVYTINPNSHLILDRAVAEIECQIGTVSAIDDQDNSETIEEGSTFVPAPGFVNVASLRGANILVTYADEVDPEPAERGDTGGSTGSFESRTKAELYELAGKRNIEGRSSMDKDELIAALRGED